MNDNVHPMFKELLTIMADREQKFDPWDDDLMHDICGKRLAKPVQDLLLWAEQLDTTAQSFGVNEEKALRMAIGYVKKLREGCIEVYQEL